MLMAIRQNKHSIVKLNTGELGTIIEYDTDNDQYKIRVPTPLFDDYQFITLPSTHFHSILQINKNSKIHDCGLFTLIDLDPFKIIFQEQIFIPFAPRIHNDDDKHIVSKVLKWWNDIKKSSNKNKLDIFMDLSYHNEGPIVDNIDTFLYKNNSELMQRLQNNKMDLNALRKALLIDGANTFDDGAYEVICRINHCCDPNCFVTTNGCVKSLRYIHRNEELSWNFLNDKYLYTSTNVRIEALYTIWGFKCNCSRCNAQFDDVRVFKCMKCSKPSIYVSYGIDEDIKEHLNVSTEFHDCVACHYQLQEHEIQYYLLIENKIDKVIETIGSVNEIEIDFEEILQHIALYLSDKHFKWFHLWNSMRCAFDGGLRDEIFGKTLKEVLIECYGAMDKIYNNSMTYCRYEIEWRLLNCIVDDKCIESDEKLFNKLYDSIDQIKDIFNRIDRVKWNNIRGIVKEINSFNN